LNFKVVKAIHVVNYKFYYFFIGEKNLNFIQQ